MDADAMFHQQHHELLTICQGDGVLICLGSFFDDSSITQINLPKNCLVNNS